VPAEVIDEAPDDDEDPQEEEGEHQEAPEHPKDGVVIRKHVILPDRGQPFGAVPVTLMWPTSTLSTFQRPKSINPLG
jgi:hypothetical protein